MADLVTLHPSHSQVAGLASQTPREGDSRAVRGERTGKAGATQTAGEAELTHTGAGAALGPEASLFSEEGLLCKPCA